MVVEKSMQRVSVWRRKEEEPRKRTFDSEAVTHEKFSFFLVEREPEIMSEDTNKGSRVRSRVKGVAEGEVKGEVS